MSESFFELFESSLKKIKIKNGSIISGCVIDIEKDIVLVDAGLKSESSIPIDQFKDCKGNLNIKIGDKVDLILESIENGFGETILSREKAKKYEVWNLLEKAHKKSSIVKGIINGKVKGGFTVDIYGIKAFLPGSLIDIKPIRDTSHLEGNESDLKVIKLDKKRNNIVVSRKAVIESENNIERTQFIKNIKEESLVKGIVKNITDYGVFIDLGGIDGLLHITDMSWKRIKHPSEIVKIGEEITVKILKFDKDKTRVSLGLKQLNNDPWISISKNFPENTRLRGKVTNLTDYGCFVEIKEGVEGLVHVSEMNWTNKNIHPSKVVNIGDIVDVVVLDIDEDKRRISLGLKQCTVNPWKEFEKIHKKGERIKGKIKSITDFGIFVGLEYNIDGLIHLSDISWDNFNEELIKKYKKGDEIIAVLLQVDSDRERISLGIKQLSDDPFNKYLLENKTNKPFLGKIIEINDKNIIINISNNINGYINCSELSKDQFNKIKNKYSIDDTILVKYSNIDKKNRIINLNFFEKNDYSKKNKTNKKIEKNNNDFSNVMIEAFKAAKK